MVWSKPCSRYRVDRTESRSGPDVHGVRDPSRRHGLRRVRRAERRRAEAAGSPARGGQDRRPLRFPARRATFVEVIAADEQQVAQTPATLPFARFFDAEVYPTTPPDAAEAAHRARS
ncbi:Uncharacterised protein [Amycolatopsis camponoti]|uniref:Uncharacterized protein n=1 Tax=Amycolatopsis camponoti TaxID=2606593 RepID=A0A6I8LY63_9PSEU|nr:Uncharacterised protein [Amycolatopsis camponoti]